MIVLLSACKDKRVTQDILDTHNTPPQEFGMRDWKLHPPKTEFEKLAYFYEGFQKNRRRGVLRSELHIYDESKNVVGILKPGLIIHSPSLDDVGDTDLSDNDRMKVLFDLPASAQVEWLQDTDMERLGAIWYRNTATVAEIPDRGEQAVPSDGHN